uniref:CSON012674 protein n=1 Tax=Culicoides sonorensis TaxID=179676 RepID=A0A336KWS8_CULSO
MIQLNGISILILPILVLFVQGTIVDQIIIDNIEVTYGKSTFLELDCRVRRANKTTYMADGNYTIKKPITDEVTIQLSLFYLNGATWTQLFTNLPTSLCKSTIVPGSTFYDFKKRYFLDAPDSCPIPSGLYKMQRIFVPRYRKDWDSGMKLVIPAIVPNADLYKSEYNFFDGNRKKLATLIGEFRLVDKNSDI